MHWPVLLVVSFALLVAATSPLDAQSSDGERKIRDVTPKNIPVIILPPRKQQNDSNAKANEASISGDAIIARISEEGIVMSGERRLQFVGVTTLAPDTLCENEAGGRWACGLRAYVTLRNLVHGKEIKCEALRTTKDTTVSRCFRERTNISEWMLSEGWALYDGSANDEALSRFTEDAQKNARGIWSDGSRPVKP